MILDGTDNFETRFLLNDAAVKRGLPWVYGGCVGAEGQTMTILPGETACLRCLMPECPAPGSTATCETAGILGPIVGVIASIEAAEAMKILSGNREAVSRELLVIDLWQNRTAADRRPRTARSDGLPDVQARRIPLAFRPRRQPHGGALRPQRRPAEPSRGQHFAR